MAHRRERGEGGLIKIKGCRFWYCQFYRDGRQVRISSTTQVNEEATKTLRPSMAALQRVDEGLSNDSVSGSLRLLRRMLNIAGEDNKIQVGPKIRLLKSNPARKGFLPKEQFDSVLSKLPINLKPLVIFLYYCGVRLGEAAQIEWKQVDLKSAVIRLEEDQTKNSEARVVPLPDVLVDLLTQVDSKQSLVFDTTNLRKEWHKACVAAGLGRFIEVEGKPDPKYTGLIIH